MTETELLSLTVQYERLMVVCRQGMPLQRAMILLAVRDKPASANQARSKFGTNGSYNIRKLDEAGLVVVSEGLHDKRQRIIQITPAGKKALSQFLSDLIPV